MDSKRYTPLLWLVLLVVASFILSACGDDKNDNKTDDSSGNATSAIPATPTFWPQPTRTAVDPGPYFSPGKPFPAEDPNTYSGPEQVGKFQRTSASGQANTAAGVTGVYTDSDNATIILNIYYAVDKPSAVAFVEQMGTSARLTTPPEFLLLDENTSYTLYELSDGRVVYAWTREQWIFVATSTQGRPSLDAFMREFPY
ncbi:hypothetical protein ARNL5_00116 [Anaerolineae bacterium]|nr:hypothetical protein ARNL5_00116 [Anaerolineae bacterium]